MIKTILLLFAIAMMGKVCAQHTLQDLDPVTITALRTPQKASASGRSITVIDGEQFRQLPVHSLDDLLRYVPGVEVQSRGPMGSQSDIVIRGGTFQQVLVLVDGMKVNDPITGHFSAYIPIAPYEIERIEVLRGPAAAIYGAEAVGGVVQVITKSFHQVARPQKVNGTIAATRGEYGLFKAEAGVQVNVKQASFLMGFQSNNSDGQQLRSGNRGYFNNHTISGSAAVKLKRNWRLAGRLSYDHRDFAAQNFYTTFASDTATEKVGSLWAQVSVRQQSDRRTRELAMVYRNGRDQYQFNASTTPNDNRSQFLLLQYLQGDKLGSKLQLNTSLQFDRRSIRSNDRGDHNTHHAAIAAALQWQDAHWTVAPGIRSDWDENSGLAVIPQLTAAYRRKALVIRSTIGRAIRSADFTERYNNYNKQNLRSGSVGNPDLETENSWSYEVGSDLQVSDAFKFSATAFYRDQANVIDYVNTPYDAMPRKDNLVPGSTYALAQNIRRLHTRGVELNIAWQKQFAAAHSLYVQVGGTLLRSRAAEKITSFYIISHARALVQASMQYRYHRFSLSATGVYKKRNGQAATAIGASVTPEYTVINARGACQLFPMVELFFAVDNLGGVQYSDLLGSRLPGRWSYGGVRIQVK